MVSQLWFKSCFLAPKYFDNMGHLIMQLLDILQKQKWTKIVNEECEITLMLSFKNYHWIFIFNKFNNQQILM